MYVQIPLSHNECGALSLVRPSDVDERPHQRVAGLWTENRAYRGGMPPSSPPSPVPSLLPTSAPTGPSITDWLQGVGTVAGALIALAALVAAVLAYRVQNKQLRHQQQQIADQQELNRRQGEVLALQAEELRESIVDRRRVATTDRRAQAAQVFVVLAFTHHTAGAGVPGGTKVWGAKVENTSALPIYEIRVVWLLRGAVWEPEPARNDIANPLPRLGPGAGGNWSARLPGENTVEQADVQAFAEFRDAAEAWWRIKLDGRIEEIEPPAS